MKIPMGKLNSGHVYATQADFEAAVFVALKKELFNSNITSDYLDFDQANRNIKVFSSFNIRPNRNNMILQDTINTTNVIPSTTDTTKSFTVPPPKTFSVFHTVPKLKTKVARATGGASGAMFPVNLWVPFTMFTCQQLTANSGHFNIEHSSRMYFTDT
jgi:hypothetical protein